MTLRKTFRIVHRYIGLIAGLVLAVTGLTGSMLVFRGEIDAMLNPELLRVEPREERVSLHGVVEAVERSHPEHTPTRIKMPESAEGVYEVWLDEEEGPRAYVDPYSGEVLGSRGATESAMGFLFHLHKELLGGRTGKIILSFMAFFLVFLAVTGAILWWPGIRRLWTGFRVKWAAGWKGLNYDVHKVAGAVVMVFLVISAVTGTSLIYPTAFQKTLNWMTGSDAAAAPPASTLAAAPRPLDRAVRTADDVLPDARITWVYLPQTPDGAVMVRKKLPQETHPSGRNFIYADRYSGELLRAETVSQATLGARLYNFLYPLHIGRLAGLWTRLLQVLVGLSLPILYVTGVFVWWNRRGKKKRRSVVRPMPAARRRMAETPVPQRRTA